MTEALSVASSVISVVDLSVKVISWCVRYAQDVSHAKEDKKRLAEELTRLNLASVNARNLLDGPHGSKLKASHALLLATVDSQSQLKRIESQLVEGSGQAKINFEALKWPFKSKDVQSIIQDLDRCTKAIHSAMEVDQTSILLEIDHQMALDRLRVAEDACFDSYAEKRNPTCLQDTRVELLKDVQLWIDGTHSKVIFWLNGMAGTGKSTISRTVAQARHDRGDLGASFFFKRGEIDRGNLAKFVPTLAYQLAWSIPGLAPLIKKTIDADSKITHKGVEDQFKKLIREPLSEAAVVPSAPSLIVLVVDALDECEATIDEIKLFLGLLSSLHSRSRLRIRVLITSRPELPVRLGFSSIEGTHQDLVLHKIPQPIIEQDIFVFFRHEFANIRNRFNRVVVEELKLPVYWPGEASLEKLTKAAVPLFIFAVTLCRFINDSCLGSPDKLLQSVLHHTSNGHVSKLDMTYSPVLEQQVVNRSGRERRDIIESFRLIVGTIITLASPLPVRALALLLNVHIDEVITRLRMLHSVLEIPESLDSPVRLFHLSFRDYLVDPENKEKVELWVDEKLAHRKLAKRCLRVMRGALCENICSLSFPGMRRSAVGVRQLEQRIPLELQYTCMYWIHHQTKVGLEPDDSREVYDFMTTHFLHWVEALSLLGRIKECLDSLTSMTRWLESQGRSNLSTFLTDAVRFLQANFSVIDEAPLQLYSCLIFAPMVFSRDSAKLASASYDMTVRIWDAETGKCERVLEGHGGWINSVAFSHDSAKVASASWDKTVRIWNAETGECERVLEGHNDSVSSVVFSHDSTKLASASDDKTIRIWNTDAGEHEQVLEAHNDSVNSVAFSHDSIKLASASHEKTVRIWNIGTGKCEQVLEGHSGWVSWVMFSHNSTKLASASYDKTVRIWNAETGECEQVLEGHSSPVNSAVFSHDSTKLATTSWDKAIQIWNVETGKCERVLEGHSSVVNAVVFSHNSTKLASTSNDETVRIWNAETGKCKRVLDGHNNSVSSVVFSHDSKKLASVSDETVRIWNTDTGECERVLEIHHDSVSSVIFSHDSTKLALTSNDLTMGIWDAETGTCEYVFGWSIYTDSRFPTPDKFGIVTNRGVFALTGGRRSSVEPSMSLQALEAPTVVSQDCTWVMTGGRDLLRLPSECRGGEVAVSGSTVAVGCRSGRVVILGFSAADMR
ncbi:heterokaryon incompatibility protein het-E-1 [Fusarium mexicanum]|uniref:Heterokaryon incompatibility protein het-E-1 n=1 Tax=Fusarium mexicanum TaxID=751941 RepID=A0A8H5I3F6_9HYPO|nr:heterokaryon incompatibility protein het-E-1 [Fusarium mexicanum]